MQNHAGVFTILYENSVLMAADIQLRSFTDKAIWQAVRWLISGVGPKMLGTAVRYNADTKKKSEDFFGKIIGRWAVRVYRCLCRRCRRRGHGRRQRLSSCYVIANGKGFQGYLCPGFSLHECCGLDHYITRLLSRCCTLITKISTSPALPESRSLVLQC